MNELKELREIAVYFENEIANKVYEINIKTSIVKLYITPANFPHLIGLHKYYSKNSDNPFLRNKDNLKNFTGFLNIKKGRIRLEDLNKKTFKKSGNRITEIEKISLLLKKFDMFTFEKSKANSKIDAEFILSQKIKHDEYIHLFIKENKGKYYPVSFLLRDDDKYIKGQVKVEVLSIKEFEYKQYEEILKNKEIIKVSVRDKLKNIKEKRIEESNKQNIELNIKVKDKEKVR